MFGRKEKDAPLPLTEAEGFCGIAACAMYSDGVLNAEEDDLLIEALLDVDVLQGFDEDALREALVKVSHLASRHGDGHLLQASVDAISPARRPEAFRLAAELILADGEVDTEERQFLERFRHALGIPDADAKKVIDALAV